MRENIRKFLEAVAGHVGFPEPIMEIGSYKVKGQEKLADLRDIFPGREYIGTDMRVGPGVDRVENAEYLRFDDAEVGSLLCIDTLQCVRNLWKTRGEMFRVVDAGGILFMASAMNAPYNINYYYNYWRFTPKGFDFMMDMFPHRLMYLQGEKNNPHTIIGIASKQRERIQPLTDSRFIEQVKHLGEEPFLQYDVNQEHAELLAADKEQAHNV